MTSPLLWLLAGLGAALLVAWRLIGSRKRKAALITRRDTAAELALALARQAAKTPASPAPAADPVSRALPATPPRPVTARAVEPIVPKMPASTSAGAPGGIERRSPGRLAADRVIAAEAERRQAALLKAQQHAARVEAERRATEKAAKIAASDLEETIVLNPPAGAPAGAAPTVVAFRAPVPATTAATPARKTAEQTLVMLADDSKMVRVKTSKLLAAHGYQIVMAVDGLDAVRQLETCLPDLVITDVDMPGLDGFGLTTHLRRTARTAHIPIVMITSAEDRHREEAMRIGVGLVMGKPYPEDELIAHVRSFAFTVAAEQEPAAALA